MKTKLIRLSAALALLAAPALVQAQFMFTTTNGATTITGYNPAAGLNVVIPTIMNGYPVTSIGDYAFQNSGITNVTIPNGVTSIGNWAFTYCPLTSVTILSSVTNIGVGAFENSGLTSVTIPNSVTSVGNYAFAGCTNLTSITVDASNPAYSSMNGVLFDKSQATLRQFPGGLGGSYTIPSSATSIGDGAFFGCTSVTSVTVPNNVTTIGTSAFRFCTGLTNVTIRNGVTSIGVAAFLRTSLTSVTIPNSVTAIGAYAFAQCSLRSAYFLRNAPSNNGNAFLSSPATVYYLSGTAGWSSTFGGVPAVLWNPHAKTFSFAGGKFEFNLIGPTNAIIVVEACTNLYHPVWLPVSTNTLSGSGTSAFSDPTGYPMRYYRFRSP